MQSDAVFLEAGSGVFFQLVMDRRRHVAQSQLEIKGYSWVTNSSQRRGVEGVIERRGWKGFNFRFSADSFYSSVSQSVSFHM